MASLAEVLPKAKKSVALSGVAAGNTALCSVGRTGNDLHYRGYDILDFADRAEFEEIAYLLVHRDLPTQEELASTRSTWDRLRGRCRRCSRRRSSASRKPRTRWMSCAPAYRCSARSSRRRPDHGQAGAQHIADRLMASLGSMLLYWYHYPRRRPRIDVETDDDSIGGAFPASFARQDRRDGAYARDAYFAHPLRRARVQREHVHRARHRRHRLRTCTRRSAARSAR